MHCSSWDAWSLSHPRLPSAWTHAKCSLLSVSCQVSPPRPPSDSGTTPVQVPESQKNVGSNHAVSGLKFRILRRFLDLGYGVLLSDVDIVTLQNPFGFLVRDCDVESMSDGWDNATAYGALCPLCHTFSHYVRFARFATRCMPLCAIICTRCGDVKCCGMKDVHAAVRLLTAGGIGTTTVAQHLPGSTNAVPGGKHMQAIPAAGSLPALPVYTGRPRVQRLPVNVSPGTHIRRPMRAYHC